MQIEGGCLCGAVMRRRFRPTCGTHLFSEAEERSHMMFIRVGALDDPDVAAPSATIWTSEAPRWACIDPSFRASPASHRWSRRLPKSGAPRE